MYWVVMTPRFIRGLPPPGRQPLLGPLHAKRAPVKRAPCTRSVQENFLRAQRGFRVLAQRAKKKSNKQYILCMLKNCNIKQCVSAVRKTCNINMHKFERNTYIIRFDSMLNTILYMYNIIHIHMHSTTYHGYMYTYTYIRLMST